MTKEPKFIAELNVLLGGQDLNFWLGTNDDGTPLDILPEQLEQERERIKIKWSKAGRLVQQGRIRQALPKYSDCKCSGKTKEKNTPPSSPLPG